MKRIIVKEMLMRPTTWAGLGLAILGCTLVIRMSIPFSAGYWRFLLNYVVALGLEIPAGIFIVLNLMRIMESHGLVRLK